VKRIFLVLVLLITTWQIVGFFSYFEWEHYHIRKDIKRALKHSVPENQLKNFDFSNKEIKNLTWIKSNEFKLNGRYYDVIKRIPKENGFHFICIDDFQEMELFQKLEESTAINLNNSSSSSPLKFWMKLLKTPFITDFKFVKLPVIESVKDLKSAVFHYEENYSLSHNSSVFSPPEKLIS
jgi:hypothetical protein